LFAACRSRGTCRPLRRSESCRPAGGRCASSRACREGCPVSPCRRKSDRLQAPGLVFSAGTHSGQSARLTPLTHAAQCARCHGGRSCDHSRISCRNAIPSKSAFGLAVLKTHAIHICDSRAPGWLLARTCSSGESTNRNRRARGSRRSFPHLLSQFRSSVILPMPNARHQWARAFCAPLNADVRCRLPWISASLLSIR